MSDTTAQQIQSISVERAIIRANGDVETIVDYYGSGGDFEKTEHTHVDGRVEITYAEPSAAPEPTPTLLERIQRFLRR